MRFASLPLSLMFALWLALASPLATASEVRILRAEFGLFEPGAPGEVLFSPTNVIPHKPGQRYGWVIELETKQRSLTVREEYIQPTRTPVVKTDKDDTLIFPNPRRHQVSERRLVPVEGRISGEWVIGEGEPGGPRHLAVLIEGAPETRFDYRVE